MSVFETLPTNKLSRELLHSRFDEKDVHTLLSGGITSYVEGFPAHLSLAQKRSFPQEKTRLSMLYFFAYRSTRLL